MNNFRPEGDLLVTAENREILYSAERLENAMARGKVLEATATLCDSRLNLHVALGPGLHGVIPHDEAVYIPTGEPIKDIAVLTRVGKPVCFLVTEKTTAADGTSLFLLSRRKAQEACYREKVSLLRPGDLLTARVTHMENFGAFVDIGCGVIALLSVDCISVSRISHPKVRFHVGEHIPVLVKSREEDGRIYVTHKELLGTWEENAALFSPGQTVVGVVRSTESYGIFVELTPNLTGLAEVREDVAENEIAAVYIKSILPEKMKIKLVIIDSHAQNCAFSSVELPAFPSSAGIRHMDRWRYSPSCAAKIIETRFEG